MTKTPDETKKGLECCSTPRNEEPCRQCPYAPNNGYCVDKMSRDAFYLIQQLQAENTEKDARIRQLEAERDAAVKDLSESTSSHCPYCKNWDKPGRAIVCINCRNGAPRCLQHFEWRGVQKEE